MSVSFAVLLMLLIAMVMFIVGVAFAMIKYKSSIDRDSLKEFLEEQAEFHRGDYAVFRARPWSLVDARVELKAIRRRIEALQEAPTLNLGPAAHYHWGSADAHLREALIRKADFLEELLSLPPPSDQKPQPAQQPAKDDPAARLTAELDRQASSVKTVKEWLKNALADPAVAADPDLTQHAKRLADDRIMRILEGRR